MKRVEAPCPACGAPVEFRVSSSLVTVCGHCSSVVARGDRKLEDLGKTAALVETASPLAIGCCGKYRGKSFELVGHIQYRHASGAVWDEWYASFASGRWGWLAEAQGRFWMTFRRKLKSGQGLPEWGRLAAGQEFRFGDEAALTVAELGEATVIAAEGELPLRPQFNQPHRYVDLSGADQRVGTMDYGESPPALYLGRVTTLAELGIALVVVGDDERHTRQVAAIQVACPQCGGSLDLHAPDRAERVVCPFCQSMLDASQGQLRYLQTLLAGRVQPLIPLGRTGTFRGREYTVIGFLQRAVRIEGTDYFWTEYLLYQPQDGFRWLVESDRHWSFVEPVAPGAVRLGPREATYQGRSFRLFQRSLARVTYVLGEFYWKVRLDETVYVRDYIAPPEMLSAEVSQSTTTDAQGQTQTAEEVNISRGVYAKHEEVEQAFGVQGLPRSWGPAANQPNPVDKRVYVLWPIFAGVLLVLYLIISALRSGVDGGWFFLALVALSAVPVGALLYGHSFEKSRWEQSYIGGES
jgi:hypothetical protein